MELNIRQQSAKCKPVSLAHSRASGELERAERKRENVTIQILSMATTDGKSVAPLSRNCTRKSFVFRARSFLCVFELAAGQLEILLSQTLAKEGWTRHQVNAAEAPKVESH